MRTPLKTARYRGNANHATDAQRAMMRCAHAGVWTSNTSHERNSLVPRSRVSVARLSRSWALRAAPFALRGAEPSGLEVSGAEAQEIARPRAPAPARRPECLGHRSGVQAYATAARGHC